MNEHMHVNLCVGIYGCVYTCLYMYTYAELVKPVQTMLMALDDNATWRVLAVPFHCVPGVGGPPWTCLYCDAWKTSENRFEGVLR